jgi:hypothetical protein
MHEFSTRLIMNYPFIVHFSKQHIIGTWRWYRSTDLLSTRVIYSSYHDPESC